MLAFRNEDVISKYDVKIQDSDKAKGIINEILKQEKREKTDVPGMIWTNYGKFDRSSVRLTEYGFEEERQSPDSTLCEYSRGSIVTDEFIYPAPYTLALAAQSFNFGIFNYSERLRKSNKVESLINVLHGTVLDDVSLLLSCFDNNPEALDIYLRNYHPDILYLRRYLECVYFRKTEERPIGYSIKPDIKNASMNSEVVRKLRLPMECRD